MKISSINARKITAKLSLGLMGCLALLGSCGAQNSDFNRATGCDSGSVVIGVNSGFLQNLCGCQEAAGSSSQAGTLFTCTATAPVVAVFEIGDHAVEHQIVADGEPSFSASPVFSTDSERLQKTHSVKIAQTGTYSFKHSFVSGLKGRIIVK